MTQGSMSLESMAQDRPAETKTGLCQQDVPWDRRWNWVMGDPERQGSRLLMFCCLVLLFNGLMGFWQLSDQSPDDGFGLVVITLQLVLLPLALTQLWGAMILRRAKRDQV